MQAKPRSPKKINPEEVGVVSGGSNPAGVIYIDQDSDITSIVTKVRSEASKDVKVVVPKNSSALKSGVNLKLLARTGHSKSKNLSLITSDAKLIAMAGAAKIATAPNLSSEATLASLSPAPNLKINNPDVDETDLEEDLTIDGSEFSDEVAASSVSNQNDLEPELSKKAKKEGAKAKKKKKVPNFTDFRKKALIGVGVFLAILFGLLLIMTSRKSAVLEISANAERLEVNFSAKLNESATETTMEEVKAVKKSGSKSVTEAIPATGQQDIGAKASGKVTLFNCDKDDNDITLSTGTGVSAGGLTYLTTSSVTVPVSNFTGGGVCKKDKSATVNVSAQNAGSQYNSAARAYTVSGTSVVTGQGSAMTGGTTQVVKVVSQADVNTLKEKLASANQDSYKTELRDQFTKSQKVLEETFSVQLGEIQLTPVVGQQAEQVSGTVTANYSMFGVENDELKKILELRINEAKTDDSQSIIKNGLDELKLSSADDGQFSFATVAFLGPKIDQEKIKQEVAGKKKGEAIQIIESQEGVNDAKVKISPFWGSSLPGADKIEVKIEVSEAS